MSATRVALAGSTGSIGTQALDVVTAEAARFELTALGATGRNLAAGMSGGLAHVLDLDPVRVNRDSVHLTAVEPGDLEPLRKLLAAHRDRTGSPIAAALLVHWPCAAARFTTILPVDYARVRAAEQRSEPATAGAGGG